MFVINLRKSILQPVKTLEFLGDGNRENDTVSLRREADLNNSTMSGGLFSIKNLSVKFDKDNWPSFVLGPSYIVRENLILFPPTGANIRSEKAG